MFENISPSDWQIILVLGLLFAVGMLICFIIDASNDKEINEMIERALKNDAKKD